jgi:prepilin-type processing-associated H-X9-DG protein
MGKLRISISPMEVVGIAIGLGLLTAFTLPMLGPSKEAAARTLCLQNQKQIGSSVSMYAIDWDETFPRTTYERPTQGLGRHWAVLVQPYIKSEEAFLCEGDEGVSAEYGRFARANLIPEIGYINNYAIIPAHDFYPVQSAEIGEPDRLIMLTERRRILPSGKKMTSWKGTSGFAPGQPCVHRKFGRDYRRVTPALAEEKLQRALQDKELLFVRADWTAHEGQANYLFADGHAATQPLAATLRPDSFQWGERFYPKSMKHARCD